MNNHNFLFAAWFLGLFLLLAISFNLVFSNDRHFVLLAEGFLNGTLGLSKFEERSSSDVVHFNGKYYWHLGPVPGLLMVIPVWFFGLLRLDFLQGIFNLFLVILSLTCLYLISRKAGVKVHDSLWLSGAFVFGSVYAQAVYLPNSWFVSQATTVCLMLMSLLELITKKRYWLIGVLAAMLYATRQISILWLAVPILFLIREKRPLKLAGVKIIQLVLPLILSMAIIFAYNLARFGSGFDTGYTRVQDYFGSPEYLFEMKKYGLFNLASIPQNIYYYFFAGLDPVINKESLEKGNGYVLDFPYFKPGDISTSFFIISPIFLLAFLANFKDKTVRIFGAGATLVLGVLLTYYWPGQTQLGPRYMLDLMPLLFVVLLSGVKRIGLSLRYKLLILTSCLFNFYMFLLKWYIR